MNSPLVSIIIVSYNHSRYIRECLNSIKNQTYKNWELIVADDASKDDSTEKIEKWLQENNIKAKKNFHRKNTGLATTLNECIAMCSGDYVKILAADDFLHEEYVSTCIEKAEFGGFDLVFTQATEVDENSNEQTKNYFPIPINPLQNLNYNLCKGNFISGATMFLRMDFLIKMKEIPKKIRLEDYYMVLKALEMNRKFGFIDENLLFYRRHGSNITQVKTIELEAETISLKMKYFTEKQYRDIINMEISKNLSKYGKKYAYMISAMYLKYPFKSKKLIVRLSKILLGL